MLVKYVLCILELYRYQRFGEEKTIENLSSSAHVIHITAKQITSRRRLDESGCEMYKTTKSLVQNCKTTVFFYYQICKFITFLTLEEIRTFISLRVYIHLTISEIRGSCSITA